MKVLLPYQQRWVADRSPVKVCEKSRRVGVSWASAAEAVLVAGASAGMDVWYIGYNKDMAGEFISDCAEWCQVLQVAATERSEVLVEDEDKKIQAWRLVLASGWRVTALSSRPTNLRGKQGLVIIDEAAFHQSLSELLKASLAMLIWGGRVVVISTHNGLENPFWELVEEVRTQKRKYSLHRITFDDALADGLYKRISAKQGKPWTQANEVAWREQIISDYGESAQEELFCVPRGGEGAYLSRALLVARSSSEAPVIRIRCPEGLELQDEQQRQAHLDAFWTSALPVIQPRLLESKMVFGFDFGRDHDLSVLAILQRMDRAWSVRVMLELRSAPYFAQEWIFNTTLNLFSPTQVHGAMDARGNGQYMAEMARMRWGSAIWAVMLSEKWYREYMPEFKAALEDGSLQEIPDDADVLRDLRALQVIRGVARVPEHARTRGTDGGPRHADSAVALALAWAATKTDLVPIEHVSGIEERLAHNLEDY